MIVGFEYSVDNERILVNVLRKYFQIFQNHCSKMTVLSRADGLRSVFMYLSILLNVPFPVEVILLEQTVV